MIVIKDNLEPLSPDRRTGLAVEPNWVGFLPEGGDSLRNIVSNKNQDDG
jgi:hypothetical protein